MPYIPVEDPMTPVLEDLQARFPGHDQHEVAVVSVSEQRLYLFIGGQSARAYPISTSKYGIGSQQGSQKTPLGVHRVRRKIGDEAPVGQIFKGRQDTGEVAALVLEPRATTDDYVTTRILWLDGMEEGVNKGEGIDSFQRFIYIHGTHEEGLIGQPASKGCVRMLNHDVVELYDTLPIDALVAIVE